MSRIDQFYNAKYHLSLGESYAMKPRGNSMFGIVNDGDNVLIEPITDATILSKHDVVLCKVQGQTYLHLIKNISHGQYQIGNNKGNINGWCLRSEIYGVVTSVNGKPVNKYYGH